MKKNVVGFIFSLFLASCTFGEKWDSFAFTIQNNCTYVVSVAYVYANNARKYETVQPKSLFVNAGMLLRTESTYKKNEEKYFTLSKEKISILYPDKHEALLSVQDFATKAEVQMEHGGDGNWILTLCPENNLPPLKGKNITPGPVK